MNLLAIMIAGSGLGLALHSAMGTEPEHMLRRVAYGLLGLVMFACVVFVM